MAEAKHTKEELRQWQALPLPVKVLMTKERIRQWVNEFGEDGVCVSFSGGKDSTVLLHLVREMYPNVKAVFSNTGLEYPEIQKFVKQFDNTDIIRPEMMFKDVITQYGYPLIGKEVAEAIYYARKLRGGWKDTTNGENSKAQERRDCGHQTNWKRTELRGGRRTNGKRTNSSKRVATGTDGLASQGECQPPKSRDCRIYQTRSEQPTDEPG